jgi:hypothetical protein
MAHLRKLLRVCGPNGYTFHRSHEAWTAPSISAGGEGEFGIGSSLAYRLNEGAKHVSRTCYAHCTNRLVRQRSCGSYWPKHCAIGNAPWAVLNTQCAMRIGYSPMNASSFSL